MSKIAVALRHMLAAGMPHEAIIAAVEEMEEAGAVVAEAIALGAKADPPKGAWREPLSDGDVWVYVMAVDQPQVNYCKVGISKHPHFRRETLERERAVNLYIAHAVGPFMRAHATNIERQAHAALEARREIGEWFRCAAQEAIEAVNASAASAIQ